jgi:hypothetical protein
MSRYFINQIELRTFRPLKMLPVVIILCCAHSVNAKAKVYAKAPNGNTVAIHANIDNSEGETTTPGVYDSNGYAICTGVEHGVDPATKHNDFTVSQYGDIGLPGDIDGTPGAVTAITYTFPTNGAWNLDGAGWNHNIAGGSQNVLSGSSATIPSKIAHYLGSDGSNNSSVNTGFDYTVHLHDGQTELVRSGKYHLQTHYTHEKYYDVQAASEVDDWGNCKEWKDGTHDTISSSTECGQPDDPSEQIGLQVTIQFETDVELESIATSCDLEIPSLAKIGFDTDYAIHRAGVNCSAAGTVTSTQPNQYSYLETCPKYIKHLGHVTKWGANGFAGEAEEDFENPISSLACRIHMPLITGVPMGP